MGVLKNGRSVMILFLLSCLGIALLGCATTSQIEALEEKNRLAMETAEKALKEAQSVQAAVKDSARYSSEAAAGTQRAESAASKAGNAAARAERAATAAEDSADRAEQMAKKSEHIFERMTGK